MNACGSGIFTELVRLGTETEREDWGFVMKMDD